ncbi:ER to Golgi transport protein Yos1 [Yamadazyma tenuis ATCC 10573]|uniref:ER to Golgi transport protein Yos1 n=1 Tax=Candida tenuis (strain ATCC 10573 / BCRC 21748 / CBS 615 / JCM 9827 / NBRC 10315 / NRRL Y-1498 / VKM Y-70) TaxID=590646 RepID=G3AXK0_CANTC|nr:ER to Golgi transport protein Yos1 [Yamadazyma tenuis ATCC 10573]EGV66404.1 ER to Golgi transport protein Yos1 [Yamadazyma tenuis ATCC 10573]
MFGFGNILYVSLLFLNAIAVLSEDRFLNRIGWGSSNNQASTQFNQFGNNETSVKTRLVNLIGATRTVSRLPLILVNTIVILYLVPFG